MKQTRTRLNKQTKEKIRNMVDSWLIQDIHKECFKLIDLVRSLYINHIINDRDYIITTYKNIPFSELNKHFTVEDLILLASTTEDEKVIKVLSNNPDIRVRLALLNNKNAYWYQYAISYLCYDRDSFVRNKILSIWNTEENQKESVFYNNLIKSSLLYKDYDMIEYMIDNTNNQYILYTIADIDILPESIYMKLLKKEYSLVKKYIGNIYNNKNLSCMSIVKITIEILKNKEKINEELGE